MICWRQSSAHLISSVLVLIYPVTMINNCLSEISQPSGRLMRDVVRCESQLATHEMPHTRFGSNVNSLCPRKNERTTLLSDTAAQFRVCSQRICLENRITSRIFQPWAKEHHRGRLQIADEMMAEQMSFLKLL